MCVPGAEPQPPGEEEALGGPSHADPAYPTWSWDPISWSGTTCTPFSVV